MTKKKLIRDFKKKASALDTKLEQEPVEDPEALVAKWREAGPLEFFESAYRIRKRGEVEDIKPFPWQREILERIKYKDGLIQNPIVFVSTPSRQGKSLLCRVLFAWQLLCAPDFRGYYISTSREQIQNIQFSELKTEIKATPVLNKVISSDDLYKNTIENPITYGRASILPNKADAVIGFRADCIGITELWKLSSSEILTGAYLRVSESNGCLLIDSLQPEENSPLRAIMDLSEDEDNAVIEVHEGKDAFFLNPDMSESQYKRLETMSLKKDFETQVENRGRSGQIDRAFSDETIDKAIKDYKVPCDIGTLKKLTEEKVMSRAVFMGLDRSEGGPTADDTALVTLLGFKINGTRHFAVSNLTAFPESDGDKIKSTVKSESERLDTGITSIGLESYQALDLHKDLEKKDYILEALLISATNPRQREAFTLVKRLMSEDRLWISSQLQELILELRWFGYDGRRFKGLRKGKTGDQKVSDDRVYALAWAVYVAHQSDDFEAGAVKEASKGFTNQLRSQGRWGGAGSDRSKRWSGISGFRSRWR